MGAVKKFWSIVFLRSADPISSSNVPPNPDTSVASTSPVTVLTESDSIDSALNSNFPKIEQFLQPKLTELSFEIPISERLLTIAVLILRVVAVVVGLLVGIKVEISEAKVGVEEGS